MVLFHAISCDNFVALCVFSPSFHAFDNSNRGLGSDYLVDCKLDLINSNLSRVDIQV